MPRSEHVDDIYYQRTLYHYAPSLTAELRARHEAGQPRKANGHAESCVCRICFEEWLAAGKS